MHDDHSHDHDHPHDHTHDHDHDHCGGCGHEGHDHSHHHHTHDENAKAPDKTLAVLQYMADHNVQHTEELTGMAQQLEERGQAEAAAAIRDAAADYTAGNEKLARALALAKEG